MLRSALLVVGGFALAAALVAALAGAPVPLALWLAVIGAMLVGGILFERGRYKPTAPRPPGPGWIATGERFADPESGEEVTVYYQPSSGERRYVGR
ncbi:MAG TPA: hypothetical protein VET89_13140 [Stellaceae bacterium]|nr:hypothetical protein [Stellaceae bacterium]